MDTLSSLMSEAMLEGYLPFGSHLHMDKSLLEGIENFFLMPHMFNSYIEHIVE